ncbi:MAG: MotA/TolQ/ExbB proton channel family protein [Victivallales bacterium]|nr:MotA/TolQ/ExbB proton channel family protein [Victivallales bacterium]
MKESISVLVEAFLASEALGKVIVVVLICASVLCLSIIVAKWKEMFVIRRGCKKFLKKYKSAKSPLAMVMLLSEDEIMPLDCVCRAGYEALKEVLERNGGHGAVEMFQRRSMLQRPLTIADLDKIRSSMVRQMNIQRNQMCQMMVMLSTIVQLAPFCGLLGTVWGVMVVFFQMGVSSSGRPEIGDMAPGVCSALLTTVVGLFVAIPAVFGNNVISGQIDQTCGEMEDFVDDFIADLQLEERVDKTSQPAGAEISDNNL